MSKYVELPIVQPVYSTYMYSAPGSAVIAKNPSIRNWYLQNVLILQCGRRFLSGYTSPELVIKDGYWPSNPYIEQNRIPFSDLGDRVDQKIREMLDEGRHVYFNGVDDYYMEGKSWYGERHFSHDGLICGYNEDEDTYCIYAYDKEWRYRTFWVPRRCFEEGRTAPIDEKICRYICSLTPKTEPVSFSPELAAAKLAQYLDSTLEQYPEDGEGPILGVVVHDYIVKYVGFLYDGFIPYERMDWRIMHLIWEHKKVMLERIQRLEAAYCMDTDISRRYSPIVDAANSVRFIYASHHKRRRDSVLPGIQKKLLQIKETEQELLTALLANIERVKEK